MFFRKPDFSEEKTVLALAVAGSAHVAGRRVVSAYRPASDDARIEEFTTTLLRQIARKTVHTHSRFAIEWARTLLQNGNQGALLTRSKRHLVLTLPGKHLGVEHMLTTTIRAPLWTGDLTSAPMTTFAWNPWLRGHVIEMIAQETAWLPFDLYRVKKQQSA